MKNVNTYTICAKQVQEPYVIKHGLAYCAKSSVTSELDIEFLLLIEAIAGPFYNIIKVMMKGPNKQSNTKKTLSLINCLKPLHFGNLALN